MNLFKREWQSYQKQTIYWGIGIIVLILIAFYKVSGISSTPGGVEGMLKSMPPLIQAFIGAGAVDYTTAVGLYSMIHLYVVIALALHAVILGANIFAKEELDKTFEFLYVKGMKRWRILGIKSLAGLSILLILDILCLTGIFISVSFMDLTLDMAGMMPFLVALLMLQIFFFTLGLVCSLILRNSQKAGMIGCCVVLVMFLINMYVRVGGDIEFLDQLSLFHYVDSSYIKVNEYGGMSTVIILLISGLFVGISGFLHQHRDLL